MPNSTTTTPLNVKNRTLFIADNLGILRGINDECIDLIYLDPPFNTNRNYKAPIGSPAEGAEFKDIWTDEDIKHEWHGVIADRNEELYQIIQASETVYDKSMKIYLMSMAVRLFEMKRILKPTGSIYLHCDPTASHYLKLVMDGLFGKKNFRNEVVWKRTSTKSLGKRYAANTDRILYYVKSDSATWNQQYTPYDDEYIQTTYRRQDKHGRWATVDLSGGKAGSERAYMPLKGIEPPPGRAWAPPARNRFPASAQVLLPDNYEVLDQLAKCEALDDAGLLHHPKGGKGRPRWKKYLSAMPGVVAGDLVLNTPPVKGKESVGYPTQKPLKLLERILRASSNEGDMVLDPFCGCATACVAAEQLGRQWIGIDISPSAEDITKLRLQDIVEDETRQAKLEFMHFNPYTDVNVLNSPPVPTRKREESVQVSLPAVRVHKHELYGLQEGKCNICTYHFPFRNLTIDHIHPQVKGGTDHKANLQLLCQACNSTKGTGTQEEAVSKVRAQGDLALAQSA